MSDFYNQHPLGNKQPGFASEIGDSTWQVNNNNRLQLVLDDDDDDGTSLRSCMFPCQENERPSQGLSLSLSSSNTRTIGLQSFERIPHAADTHDPNSQEETRFMDPCFIRDVGLSDHDHLSSVHQQIILQGYQFDLRRCKHLVPAQELLNEFCGLETKLNEVPRRTQKQKQHCDDADGSSASRLQSLSSLDFLDLQKRKRKLVSMLEELERRYMHYCNQMNAVVSSFESAAGVGAAAAYSSLASKAMSKHFRYLKDCIVTQIHATKKAMGEKDQVAPGTSRSETPTPRVIDQALRKQRAFQQISMMGIHPWRPQRGLSERSAFVLRAWLFEHFLHPYPSDADKHILARQTGLSRSQVSNWFINARVRLWKPLVEQMYMEESKDGVNEHDDDDDHETDGRLNILTLPSADQKPTPDQDKNDSISNRGPSPNKGSSFHGHHEHTAGFRAFGAVELDFSSYNHPAGGVSFAHHNERTGGGAHGHNVNFNGGVSSMFLGPSDFRTVVQQLTGLQKNTKVSSDDDQLLTENKCGSIYQVTTVPKEQIPRRHNKKLPPPGTMENRALSRSSLLVFEDPLRLEQERSQNRSDNRRHPRSLAVGTQQKQSNDLHADAPLSSLQATRFRAEYFVELKFAGCTLYEQAWLGRQRIGSLRVIDFSNSNLKNLPDLSEAHQLTSLILRGCKNLANVACIQYLAKLEHLNLKGCTKLTGLPSMMHLKLLSSIDLSHCRNLKRLPVSIGSLSSLTSLNLKNCKRLEVLPVSNLRVKSIQSFDISGCSNLIKRASAAMRTLEFYMHMTVEAMHLADVFGDIRDLVEARFHQTSNLQKREDLRDITCFLEEIKESIPRTVASMRSALTCRTSLEERLAHVSASFLEAQGECFALDAKLTMLSDEESKLDAEIEALIARKEEPLELSN